MRLRRLAQRSRKRDPNAVPFAADFKASKRDLKRPIKSSQRRCWQKLASDLNLDPWELGYKIVTRKFGAFTLGSLKDAQTITIIVEILFPTHIKRTCEPVISGLEPPFSTMNELIKAVLPCRIKKLQEWMNY